MAKGWLNLREWISSDRSNREGRSSVRSAGKSPGKNPGKTTGKSSVKSAGTGANKGQDHSSAWAIAMGLGILVLHLVLFPPMTRISSNFPSLGELATEEIEAPFPFKAPLLESDGEMKRAAKAVRVPPVLNKIESGSRYPRNTRINLFLDSLTEVLADTTEALDEKIRLMTLQFSQGRPNGIPNILATRNPDSLMIRLENALSRVMSDGVADKLPDGEFDQIVIMTPQAETLYLRDRIIFPETLENKLFGELMAEGMNPQVASHAANVMSPLLTPNLIYDPVETRKRVEAAKQSVNTDKEFLKGELIIGRSEKVTEQHALYLGQLEILLKNQGVDDDGTQRVWRYIYRGLLVCVALGMFGWLAFVHFRDRLRILRLLITMTTVMAVYLAGAAFALDRPALGPLAVPVILLALFSTVLFKARVGYTLTLLGVTILAFLPDVEPANIFTWYILGMVSVVSFRRAQKRSQFYRTMLLLTFLSVTLIFLLGPESFGRYEGPGHIYMVGMSAPILLVAFGLFLLPVIEPLVGVCSDLRLLELSDLNHPLLKRMALQAQGTYHHSQVVGQLAEHAARAIGANALLTRVGALFHDIGKMQKSEYYVENQRPEYNKHDELSPSMSALVIAAHVKDGMELGRKWRLPQMVIDFIPEHHGTMVMEYFYHKALEAEGNETVKVDDFRYPGPKPRSRETAILMLADAVEAATRSLAKPTPSRIREITKQIIDKRMLSGEMDQSGLTLSDLADIREAFIPLLTGIHHSRIVYPGQKDRDGDRVPERRGERKSGS